MSRSRVFLRVLASALLATGVVVTPAVAASAAPLPELSAGAGHVCGVDAAGGFCWGDNGNGQIGDGTKADRRSPVAVAAPDGARFSSLVTGVTHTCGLTAAGAAYCWGGNENGQLGDGTQTDRTVPTAVTGGLSFASLAGGREHTCGVTTGGVTYCWGMNESGQLGNGTTSSSRTPVAVAGDGLPAFTTLTAGSDHTCALAAGAGAYCWGDNYFGQVGNGTAHQIEEKPVPVGSPDGAFAAIATFYFHTCGLTAAGKAFCWGDNSSGQLGDGTRANRSVPTAVATNLSLRAVATGVSHTCGVATSGAAFCWGANRSGELGDGTDDEQSGLVEVAAGGRSFRTITSGFGFSCGLVTAGTAFCWGANGSGQHGNGTQDDGWSKPVRAPADSTPPVSALSAADDNACEVGDDGVVRCWGENRFGEVGDGTLIERDTPVPVSRLNLPSGARFSAVSNGWDHTCGIAEGDVYCWGFNKFGELGDGTRTDRTNPVAVVIDDRPPGTVFTEVSAASFYTCALTRTGAVYCWGLNGSGQSGGGDESETWTRPRRVNMAGLPDDVRVVAITTGGEHTCALASDGVAHCWGANLFGELGGGSADGESHRAPEAVRGPTFVALDAGNRNVCGLTSAGAAYCWGRNERGELGDGSTTDRWVPTAVTMPAGGRFTDIDADLHTCAVDAAGGVYCWGPNSSGEVGENPGEPRNVPVAVPLPSGERFAEVATGYGFTCARTTAGAVWCWGASAYVLGADFAGVGSEVVGFPSTSSPADTVPPAGTFTLSTSSLWVGQSTTLTLSGVSDDTSTPQQIGRTVEWGDGTTSTLPPTQLTATRQYPKAGTYQVTLTLTDAAGNKRTRSSTAVVSVPGRFRLDPTSAWHGQPVKLAISSVPAGTTKIAVNWGDGYTSALKGVDQTAAHAYYHRDRGGLVPVGALAPTVVLTNANGATTPIPVGTLTIKRDTANPKVSITRPGRPERVSSWKTIRGAASDQGSGVRVVRVLPLRTAAGKTYCYTKAKKWVRVSGGNTSGCGVDVSVSRGAWSLPLTGLAKGTLTVTATATDWSDRAGPAARTTQSLTRA